MGVGFGRRAAVAEEVEENEEGGDKDEADDGGDYSLVGGVHDRRRSLGLVLGLGLGFGSENWRIKEWVDVDDGRPLLRSL